MIQKTCLSIIYRQFSTRSAHVTAVKGKIQSNREPFITCKRPEFNSYIGDSIPVNAKLGTIPLASQAWKNRKSKGDFFIIHPYPVPANDVLETDVQPWGVEFKNIPLHETIVRNLDNEGFNRTTWIQNKVIPLIQANQHVLMAAETGCGKTLAYLLPLIEQVMKTKEKLGDGRKLNTPLLLIMTPGRELAEQIEDVARKMCEGTNLQIKSLLGGKTKQLMMNPTFEPIDILIGTVGVISKLTTTNILRMHECRHVVLDEADTLLDESFSEKMVHFLKRFPFHKNHLQDVDDKIVGCQLILASATMPTNTDDMLQNVINPETIVPVASPRLHRILSHVPQRFLRINKSQRPIQLLSIVKSDLEKSRPVIVFSNTSPTSDFVSIFLNQNGINCVNLNGDMLQKIRLGRFKKFQTGEVNVLATTDIASRGLDTTRVKHVINFDFPRYVSDYIHRCGRTGRVGSDENCFITNFVSSALEIDTVNKIEHAARTMQELENVDANIKKQIEDRIKRKMEALGQE